ncbi:hypothetical protein [Bacteroides sp. 224]|uniref:hypothetical protein n=1 Tax=Bacteroides sp. 224 TaxID=2302936 RepID=UPI0013CF84A2|nr:hypothetical protein [Bacteroides sp. 224]NDV66152.1 hypothetical protein [Bacteroides sp. 224]
MIARRTATKVKNGRVQPKNRHKRTPNYWNTFQKEIQLDVMPPGKGYKHFLKTRDIKLFLEILPNREVIDQELDAIILDKGDGYTDGWYNRGVIGICAWEKEKTKVFSLPYFRSHQKIFERLEVSYQIKKDYVICDFTENQIKAYLLLHILLHEIGHHHDRIHTKSRRRCAKGEAYAEKYAYKYEELIWNKYFELFPR